MNIAVNKDHTEAYAYLKAVADKLDTRFKKLDTLCGRCADDVIKSVARQCCREWDEAVVKAIDSDYPTEDIRAAICRLKNGKKWLNYVELIEKSKAA